MIESLKRFVMGLVKAVQESQFRKATRFTRDYRLNKFLESKGCQDVSCVEHWIKEFEKQESRYGYL